MGQSWDRRGLLSAGALLMSGAAARVSNSQSANPSCRNVGRKIRKPDADNGSLVLFYDDGRMGTYNQAFPIHQYKNAPACAAVITLRIDAPGFMSVSEIQELVSSGWEIVSHGHFSRYLGTFDLRRDVSAGDKKIYCNNYHGKTNDKIKLFDEDNEEIKRVVGRGFDDKGEHLLLHHETKHEYRTDRNARERLLTDVVKSELYKSRMKFWQWVDLDVPNYIYMGGGTNDETRSIILDYYNAVGNGGVGSTPINTRETSLSAMDRFYFDQKNATATEIKHHLDTIADNDALGLFGTHPRSITDTRILNMIDWARERGIVIRTFDSALRHHGFIDSDCSSRPNLRKNQL